MLYPIGNFFLYDSVDSGDLSRKFNTTPLRSLKSLAISFHGDEDLKNEIIKIVCDSDLNSRFNVLDALWNYFPDLLFSKIKFSKEDFKSPYIVKNKNSDFLAALNSRIDIEKFEQSMLSARKVADIDVCNFVNKVFIFSYRNYFKQLTASYSIAPNPKDIHVCKILEENEKYEEYKREITYKTDLSKFKVSAEIDNYIHKKEYVTKYKDSYLKFGLKSHEEIIGFYRDTDNKKLKDLLEQFIKFHPDVDVKYRNRCFKNLMFIVFKYYLNLNYTPDMSSTQRKSFVRKLNRVLNSIPQ